MAHDGHRAAEAGEGSRCASVGDGRTAWREAEGGGGQCAGGSSALLLCVTHNEVQRGEYRLVVFLNSGPEVFASGDFI